MFSSKSQLRKRTPEHGTDRKSYLSLLVDEFINSSSFDAKSQVLANLANFAYDPINYRYIRDVGVLDIFLYVIKKETEPLFLHFACTGISNLCIDPLNAEYLITSGALPPLLSLLKCEQNDVVSEVITILIYMRNSGKNIQIETPDILKQMQNLQQCTNNVIVNLATIYLNEVNKNK